MNCISRDSHGQLQLYKEQYNIIEMHPTRSIFNTIRNDCSCRILCATIAISYIIDYLCYVYS